MSVSTRLNILFKGVDNTAPVINKMQGNFASMAKKMAGIMAGAFGAKVIVGKSKEIIQNIHAVNDAAAAAGTDTEFLQKLQNAFGQVGLSAEDATKSITEARKNLALKGAIAGNIFEQYGMDVKELRALSPEELFKRMGKEIASLPNEIDRARLSQEAFGRSGGKMAHLFRKGPEAFIDGLDGVMNMLPVVDQQVANSMSGIDDTWSAVTQTMMVDWANAMGGVVSDGEGAFGRVEVAIFRTFLKSRLFVKNTMALFEHLKDGTKAIFTDDTVADSLKRMEQKFVDNIEDMENRLDKFKDGLKAKDEFASMFDKANNGATKLIQNMQAIKRELTGMTLAGSYKALQRKLLRDRPARERQLAGQLFDKNRVMNDRKIHMQAPAVKADAFKKKPMADKFAAKKQEAFKKKPEINKIVVKPDIFEKKPAGAMPTVNQVAQQKFDKDRIRATDVQKMIRQQQQIVDNTAALRNLDSI